MYINLPLFVVGPAPLYLNPGNTSIKLKNRNENLATAVGNRTLTLIYIGHSSYFFWVESR